MPLSEAMLSSCCHCASHARTSIPETTTTPETAPSRLANARLPFSLNPNILILLLDTASQDHDLLREHRCRDDAGQFTKWLRRLPVEPDVALDLLTTELACLAAT